MTRLAPTTPVIVGVGFRQDKSDDPTRSPEAYQLMVEAARGAADDAGFADLLGQLDSISVTQGLWHYPNPGKLIADALACPSARSIVAGLGVLQLTPLSDLCRAIAAGEQEVGLVGRLVPRGQTLAEAKKIAAEICDNGPRSIRALMQMLREVDESYSESDALAKELEIGGPVFGTRDAREGMKAFAEKRKPVYTGE